MTHWPRVKWTEAGQLVPLLGSDPAMSEADAKLSPEAYCLKLIGEDQLDLAAQVLGVALPRVDGIAWAASVLDTLLPEAQTSRGAPIRALVGAWIEEPDHEKRKQAWEMAEAQEETTPEQLLAMALFLSGGSISMDGLPPVLPPEGASGRIVGGAIVLMAHRSKDPAKGLQAAIERGLQIAQQGAA